MNSSRLRHLPQPIYVLHPASAPVCYAPAKYLFRENIKVECDLKVECPEFECRHIRHDHLPRSVYRLPRTEDQIWVFVLDLTWPAILLMLRLRLDTKVGE